MVHIAKLILKYYEDQKALSPSEGRQLESWRALSEDNQRIFEKFRDPAHRKAQLRRIGESGKEEAWGRIIQKMAETEETLTHNRQRVLRMSMAVAAAGVLIIVGAVLLRDRLRTAGSSHPIASKYGFDVLPGGNKAMLTLADGSKIPLTGTHKGMIAVQGDTKIEKLDDGQLAYDRGARPSGELLYNTLTTPPAGQYKIILPDGTQVWLNNASSLRYPTRFTGKNREVELQGEAYFDVARSTGMPFKVKVNGMDIDVLGTRFNIMAYGDEPILKTTLEEGSVKVSEGDQSLFLKPGQQANWAVTSRDLRLQKDADLESAVSWKKGLFHFSEADIQTVMRTLARWYDIRVVYEGPVTDHQFGGDIQRDLKLSQVLNILEKNNVHFSIDEGTITVKP